jgi:alcohol dehydrogenase class IV
MNNSLIGDMARTYALPGLKRAAGLAVRMVPVPQPTLLVGAGSSVRLGQAIGAFAHEKILLVTDAVVLKLGLAKGLMDALKASGTDFVVFDEITPDAPIAVVEKGIEEYQSEHCDAIVAFGGGSVMDAAKAIGQSVANERHPRDLVGYFRGWKGPPPMYAVPTTAGTGSEVTVAAVISDPENHKKLVIADSRLVPRMAALDPSLMIGLPKPITAATGMDALTHAVEAYIGNWGTEFTDSMALAAVSMIYENLPLAYANGKNLAAREQMALASAYAGMAFTRANVGNVHAIAHQLGGRYHTPHGLANAILLPVVLRFSSAAIEPKLATLARRAGLAGKGDSESRLAQKFLDSIEAMNRTLGIPKTLDALREKDIPGLAAAACWEADTNYPVPRAMSQSDCEALLRELLPLAAAKPKPKPKPKQARRAKSAPV